MTSDRIAQLLDDIRLLDPTRFELVEALRQLILGLDPAMREEVKYGGILFGVDQHFCGIFSYTHHITLEFGDGARLPDPYKMLEGSGKQRRHIKLMSKEDFAGKKVADYLEIAFQAADRN